MPNPALRLKILQVGEPVLRQRARPLQAEEIRSREIQDLIEHLRETLRDAPGWDWRHPKWACRCSWR